MGVDNAHDIVTRVRCDQNCRHREHDQKANYYFHENPHSLMVYLRFGPAVKGLSGLGSNLNQGRANTDMLSS